MSKGGTTTSTSSIDPQIKEAFLANFQQAQGVAGALPVQQFAGYNPMYQAGEEALVNTALAGPGITGTDLAAQMAAYGGMYQPGQVTAQQTNLGLTGPGSISSYMNPYTEAVRTNALSDLESARRAAIAQTGERATAALPVASLRISRPTALATRKRCGSFTVGALLRVVGKGIYESKLVKRSLAGICKVPRARGKR